MGIGDEVGLKDKPDESAEASAREAGMENRFLAKETAKIPVLPDGIGYTGTGAVPRPVEVMVDGKEVGQVGGVTEWLEIYYGTGDIAAKPDDSKDIGGRWLRVTGRECPWDLDDTVEASVAEKELEDMALLGMSKRRGIDALKARRDIEVDFDLDARRDKFIKQAVERLGGIEVLNDIWRNCHVVTLKRPFDEKSDWIIILQSWKDGGKGDGTGEWRRFALALPDFESMLTIGDGEGQVKLPALDKGDTVEQARFKTALGRIRKDGVTIANAALFVEDWPKKKEK